MRRTPPSSPVSIFDGAHWIWPDNPHWDLFNGYALFRTRFALPRVPAKAPFFITADQAYRLYVNGRFVARGPARGFQASWPYDEIDLRPWLRAGGNVIAVRAYNPGCGTFQYVSQGFAGLLAAARWGSLRLATGPHWRSIRQPNTRRHAAPRGIQLINAQEHADLRDPAHGWQEPDYDDRAWGPPSARVWNSAPWTSLEPRGIPMLREEIMPFGRLLGIGRGPCAEGYGDAPDVVAVRMREDRTHRPAGSAAPPLVVPATGRHRFRSYLFDFGRTVVGNLRLTAGGAGAGAIIDTHYAETVDAATLTPDQNLVSHSRLALGERLILREGDNEHAFFHHHGFRYLTLTVRNTTRPLRLDPALQWIGYPLRRNGAFESSDPLLNRIWETCAWTQQCCSLDAYVDTPWREQAQWWGDARVQSRNTFFLDGDARLVRRGLRQIGAQATPDGVTYGHAPTIAHNCILPDFTLIWLITLWDYYWQTGSTEPFRAHAGVVERALGYFRAHTDAESGLIAFDDRFWLFLDWADLPREGASSVYNLWLLIALEKLAALHRIDGCAARARPLEDWARRLRRALARLVDGDGLMLDGLDRRGRPRRTRGIHAQTLAGLAGLEGFSVQTALERIILPWIRGRTRPAVVPSAYWVTFVFDLLTDRGHPADVIAFIRRHWEPMAAHGTTWENYAPRRGEESHSHAWSAHPLFHFARILGGVTQTAPAWKSIRFEPLFAGSHGGATIPSPRGPLVSAWKRNADGTVTARLRLPRGVSAEVRLPGIPVSTVTGTRRWTMPAVPGGLPAGA